MTVCVAAICDNNTIIGASDRMVTMVDSGMLSQPNQAKTRVLTMSIVAMWSGDAALQTEVISRVKAEVDAHVFASPEVWLHVRWVAERYAAHWAAVRRERAERAILWPLGLTVESYLARQATMSEKLVGNIAADMLNFGVPAASAIIAGVDTTGAHLYHFENGALQCMDLMGFAYIGSGGRHAASQLALDQYGPLTPTLESILLVHAAKRRAEVAPGVGRDTDLWIVGPQLGSWAPIFEDLHSELDRQFTQIKKAEDRALVRAKSAIKNYVEMLGNRGEPKGQAGEDPPAIT